MMQFKIKNRKKSVFCNAWQCLQNSVLKSSVCGFFRSENVQPLCGLPVAANLNIEQINSNFDKIFEKCLWKRSFLLLVLEAKRELFY